MTNKDLYVFLMSTMAPMTIPTIRATFPGASDTDIGQALAQLINLGICERLNTPTASTVTTADSIVKPDSLRSFAYKAVPGTMALV